MNEKDLEIQQLKQKIKVITSEANRAKNELCFKCGRYENSYKGACDGCHFYEEFERNIK